MRTERSPALSDFAPDDRRRGVAAFDGGPTTSNAAALPLGATDRAINLVSRFAACFREAQAPERVHCARGEMENRIKECQLGLFAGRASAAGMRANLLRLRFASMAHVLRCAMRRIGLAHTQFAAATCATSRLALLKIGAQVRRITLAMASGHPFQNGLAPAHARITAAASRPTGHRTSNITTANAAHRAATPPFGRVTTIEPPNGQRSTAQRRPRHHRAPAQGPGEISR